MIQSFLTKFICSITLVMALFISPLRSEVIHPDGGEPGVYSVGKWTGQCFRDGFLNGREHEDCGAILAGPVKIWLFRTSEKMDITITTKSCKKGKWEGHFAKEKLSSDDRAAQLLAVINNGVKRLKSGCVRALPTPVVTASDLSDILTETDGLEF